MNKITIGDGYSVSPSSVRVDQEMVEFNRAHTDEEYLATKLSIESIGQITPIAINSKTGLMEDGAHRLRSCKELGIDIHCIEVDGELSKEIRLQYYNLNTMSGRDLTIAQKAIQAHKYAVLTGTTLEVAASKFKTTARHVRDANAIAGLKRHDVLDAIMEDGTWTMPNGKKSKSLRAIASELRSESEVLEDGNDKQPEIVYEDMINTEKGKGEFWRLLTLVSMSHHELALLLVEVVNHRYVLVVDEETGEIEEEDKK